MGWLILTWALNALLIIALVMNFVYSIVTNKSRKAYMEAVADGTQQNERLLLALAKYNRLKEQEKWNIRLLRQEIKNRVKDRGGTI
ncbi:MAG: hypothetical protein NHB14_20850 [Desulfosporosinus sp.]|nr:hypothetical protein [Desulfosporosinus sp.]